MKRRATTAESDRCAPSELLAKGLLVLQEKWVLFIVKGLLDGPLGFNELSRRAYGVNPTTLSQRMDMLEREHIVEKVIHSSMPPKVSYTLTERGEALRPVIEAIGQWASTST